MDWFGLGIGPLQLLIVLLVALLLFGLDWSAASVAAEAKPAERRRRGTQDHPLLARR